VESKQNSHDHKKDLKKDIKGNQGREPNGSELLYGKQKNEEKKTFGHFYRNQNSVFRA